jgi:hypothetical protein
VLAQDTPLVTNIWHKNLQGARKRVQHLGIFFLTEPQVYTCVAAGIRTFRTVISPQANDAGTIKRVVDSLKNVSYELEKR